MRNATTTQPITALCLLVGFIILAAGISIGRASGLIGSGWFLLGLRGQQISAADGMEHHLIWATKRWIEINEPSPATARTEQQDGKS